MNKVGEKIKGLRKSAKLSQKQLAAYLEVDQSYISKIEKDERSMTIDMLEKIAYLFGSDLSYFTDEESMSKPLEIGFRTDGILKEDLEVIGTLNKLMLNLRFIDSGEDKA